MTVQQRLAIAATAAILALGFGFAPAAHAMDTMSKGMMHKHMKKAQRHDEG